MTPSTGPMAPGAPHGGRLGQYYPPAKASGRAIWNDLFHEAVPFAFIEKAFDRMGMSVGPWHLFLVLTKRPGAGLGILGRDLGRRLMRRYLREENLWFGFTAENQAWFDRRWPYARLIPGCRPFRLL